MADLDIPQSGSLKDPPVDGSGQRPVVSVPFPARRENPPPVYGDEYLGITTRDLIAFGHDDIAKHVAAWSPNGAQRHLFLALAPLALMECDDQLVPASRIYPHVPVEHGKVVDVAAARLREGREVAMKIHERLVAIKACFWRAAEAMEKNSAGLQREVSK